MCSMIDVVIPVGPSEANVRWLPDAIQSIKAQTMPAAHIILVDDGARLYERDVIQYDPSILVFENCWRSGVTHSFNFGVAQAVSECALMMGSDDTLEPECLERCWHSYLAHGMMTAYYWLDVHYMISGKDQAVHCNAAMVTKELWNMTGGLPIEAACGAGDAALLSIMMVHMPDRLIRVQQHGERPLYNYRDHSETDTMSRKRWHQLIIDIRNLVTEEWTQRWTPIV